MPKQHKHKIKGGFLEGVTGYNTNSSTTFSSLGNTVSQQFGELKKSLSNWWNPNNQSTSYFTPSSHSYAYSGGRKKTAKRKQRGGFKSNTPVNGIASNAGSFSGSPTAKPHNLVGGKTRCKRAHRSSKRKH
jgi:hypothetical protein